MVGIEYPVSIISGNTIRSAPAFFASEEKSRTLRRLTARSPSAHEIWAAAIFIIEFSILTQIFIERADLARVWPAKRDCEHHENCANPPTHHGNYWTEQRGCEPGFERTEFIRCADEDVVHR